MPVKVTDLISTTDPSDTYATHDAAYGKGGFRSVADITARNAITTERKTVGMWCKVLSDGKVYEWDGTTWNEVVFGTSTDDDMFTELKVDTYGNVIEENILVEFQADFTADDFIEGTE